MRRHRVSEFQPSPRTRSRTAFCISLLGVALFLPALLTAQQQRQETPRGPQAIDPAATSRVTAVTAEDRVSKTVDDQDRVILPGNLHPMAHPEFDAGALPADQPLDGLVLVLRPSPKQQAALTALLVAQEDRSSAVYRHWLTPSQYGAAFGISSADLAEITSWLERYGLRVDAVPEGRQTILFSGTADQVESAFYTSLRRYKVGEAIHFANSTDPQIPAALADVIGGVLSLHDFRSQPTHSAAALSPLATSTNGYHYLAPTDFATIYNVAPLYDQGLDGSGRTIAVVARSNVNLSDIRQFRTTFSLPAKDPVVVAGSNPALGSTDDQSEATLDAEWAGAVARNATVLLAPFQSTGGTDGAFLSAQFIVNKNLAPIVSMSFAACEAALGTGGNSFFSNLWQQAAAQGITVLVSSGDSGAAECDAADSTRAVSSRAVNGICSTPQSTCVGGTEFDDTALPSLYWNAGNDGARESAKSYIPENAWNESLGTSLAVPSGVELGTGLWAGGGGISAVYTKPVWQTGVGVPADGMRDVPDVAFTASGHDGYLGDFNGQLQVYSGTSLAVTSFAGLVALLQQSIGAALGAINPALYSLAARSFPAPVMHDSLTGNNTVPGVTGYAANPGYDLVTGLGSIDAQALLSNWSAASSRVPLLHIATSLATVRVAAGAASILNVTVAAEDGSNGAVTLSLVGLPPGVTATYSPLTVGFPGASKLLISANRLARSGSYSVHLLATFNGVPQPAVQSVSFILTLMPWRGIRRWTPVLPAQPVSPLPVR